MFEFDMVKLVILLLMGPFVKFDCSRYQCSSERFYFSLRISGKFAGLSNKFEPSMVFDPSEFEGPRFDLYICKLLISILSWFFHTIFKDLTEQTLYPRCNKMHHFASFWKTIFCKVGMANPRPPTAFSLSRVCKQWRIQRGRRGRSPPPL